ncbi:MAG TPA: polyribonucleotide nucleotidyltransferase [bacterium]|nr:polyribonucleotide nucleotidyltransferase [bacterium]
MYKKVSVMFQGRELSLETGKIAKQASGSVVARYGDTVVLATVVAEKNPNEPGDFVPLTVNYQEKFYSAGKIPGGFFKRESRSTDTETLTSRLIDRPIRPLFPKSWMYETQIIPTVLSADLENNPGILSLIGVSAALEISPIPFEGPVAAVQVGRIAGEWIINPTYAQAEESDLELVVAGNRLGITMVEGGANVVPEEEILEGIFRGYEALIPLLDLQDELRQAVGVPKTEIEPFIAPPELIAKIEDMVRSDVEAGWRIPGKTERHDRLRDVWKTALAKLKAEEVELGPNLIHFVNVKEHLDTEVLRNLILKEGVRADGRHLDQVRPVTCETGILPRAHGSALFTRGETQAMVVITLGTRKDERKIERLEDEYFKTFFLHYNFPPYSVGETKRMLGPGRREIGHGNLAERAIARVLPEHDGFPYTIRIVSEITESNGSSSMATVCGASLSLMDAGVPVKAQVAGVAMGLIKEDEGKFHVLTDIMGDEDHCGDMDFKVAGTSEGVTAVQMDIKTSGLNREIMGKALSQAREARLHILGKMNEALREPRTELSTYAPRIVTLKIPVDKIRDVIGPGGKVIRGIIEQTGATIDVEDDGTVHVASPDQDVNDRAIKMIKDLTAEPEVGAIYTGTVVRITDFGAFVEIMPGRDGLLHISEIENRRIEKVTDVLHEGDQVTVKCLRVDPDGKVGLSRKAVLDQQPAQEERPRDADGPPPGARPYRGDRGPDRGGDRPNRPDRGGRGGKDRG